MIKTQFSCCLLICLFIVYKTCINIEHLHYIWKLSSAFESFFVLFNRDIAGLAHFINDFYEFFSVNEPHVFSIDVYQQL